ncbi:MAG: hypothetical protein P8P39_05430, partial [SAR86 cluster bacterium]|nr:hypothetical protein [SAR86 cluster bacterium]
MNNFYKSTPIFVVGLFFLSMPAFSYNSDPQKCADIPDPNARLHCYDTLFQESKSTQETITIPKKTEVVKTDEQKAEDYGLAKPKDDFSITSEIVKVNKRGNYKIYITL